jgi:hypothetical protein
MRNSLAAVPLSIAMRSTSLKVVEIGDAFSYDALRVADRPPIRCQALGKSC